MLVMAIEAARQACDSARVISGYEIRDAVFFNALLCGQTAQGVETKFYLTPLKDASDKTRAWSSFRLCSYQKGVWIDNCQGMVAVACRDEENEVDCGTEVKAEHIANQKLYDSGVENCRLGLRFKKLYEILDMLGLNYGPCFQVISEVSYNHDGEAVGKIKLRGTQTTGVSTLKGPIIHPTALDGVLQLAFPALSKGGDRHIPTMVPMRIQHFWVSAALQHQSSDGHIKAYAKAVLQGLREANSSIVALDGNNVPRLKVEGFQSIAVVSQRNILESQHNWKRICYNINWKPDMDLISNQKITALCKTAHVSDIGQDRLRDEMELACFIFISEVVDALARQNIQPTQSHLGKYVKWMRKMIESQQADSIRFRQDWQNILNDAAYKRQFLDHINMTGPEGKFYVEINKCLLGILQGQTDSLEILFGGSLVADYYRATNYGSKAALEPFFDALAHKNPGLEVLEVGAGTGSATLSILEILAHHGGYECGNPRFAHYTFTDLSAGFFGKAREEFGEQSYGRMIFKTLDIEIDPAKQGFNEGTYDVVVASNVIHATQSLDNALKNVRKLLKPNGKFVLLEVTNSDIFRVGFVFGLLPGWWYGREDFRQSGPTVTEEKWHELLLRNGFTGLDTSIRDSENSHNYIGSLMISTAAESHPENPCLPALMLIADCCSSLQSNVALEAKSVFDTSSSTSCRIITPSEVLQTDLSTTFCIFLLELESPILANINAENYARLQKIISTAQGLLWVTGQSTNKPELEMVSGLSRCVRAENAAFKFITLAVENISTIAENMVTVLKALHYCSANSIEEYREMDGLLCINRAVEANYVNDHIHSQLAPSKANPFKLGEEPLRALSLGIACPGLLDTLEFVEDATPHNVLASDEVEVEVKVCGMNFLDIMVALGQVSNDYLGVECSGVVRQLGRNDGPLRIGDRVCCCAPGTFRTLIRCKSEGVWQIPDTVTFHEAAALPVVFSTAYHALYNVARIQHGELILIHFGAGGMGQATIQLAKLFNAEIFATVGTAEKKNLLISLYGIPESHIFSSRNLSFRQGIKRMTKGCGVDIAINALAGEGLLATWECMAPFGRFIEIGKKDIYSHSNLPMFQFAKNVTFAAVDLNYMIREATKLLVPIMRSVLDLAAEKKIHAPKPIHVYAASQTIEAFRYLQSGKNTGKTVIEFKAEDVVPVSM